MIIKWTTHLNENWNKEVVTLNSVTQIAFLPPALTNATLVGVKKILWMNYGGCALELTFPSLAVTVDIWKSILPLPKPKLNALCCPGWDELERHSKSTEYPDAQSPFYCRIMFPESVGVLGRKLSPAGRRNSSYAGDDVKGWQRFSYKYTAQE